MGPARPGGRQCRAVPETRTRDIPNTILGPVLGPVLNSVRGSYVDRDAARRAIDDAQARDPVGHRVHLALACVACACVAGPVSAIELGVLPLAAFFLARFPSARGVWIHGFGQPAVLATLALAAWMALSLLWSPRPSAGAEHLAQLRWILLVPLVYPVIDRRGALIAALVVGLILGHAAQIIDYFDGMGNAWLAERLERAPDRVSGWWDPSVGGSVLVAALGLHLAPALGSAGRVRTIGIVGVLVTAVALVATGTRGAWIAGAALVVIAAAWRLVSGRAQVRSLAPAAGALGVAIIAAALVFGGGALDRIGSAREGIARALDGDPDSFVGARLSMARGALETGLDHPVLGVGAGGYKPEMARRTDLALDDAAHAHNLVLHWLAELGIVGVALGALMLAAALAAAAPRAHDKGPWGYAQGPFWGLVGLVLVSAFGTLTIDVNTMAMLGALAAMSPVRPAANAPRDPTSR